MIVDIHNAALKLTPGQVLRLRAELGTTVHCVWGTLWITQEGLARDDFLRAGESMRITSIGLTLVEAVSGNAAGLILRAPHATSRVVETLRVGTAP
ncbi:MAG: DUF2917 domain-containing protein [Betaproteobacteria bacterium]|jgi:hypothetical protein